MEDTPILKLAMDKGLKVKKVRNICRKFAASSLQVCCKFVASSWKNLSKKKTIPKKPQGTLNELIDCYK